MLDPRVGCRGTKNRLAESGLTGGGGVGGGDGAGRGERDGARIGSGRDFVGRPWPRAGESIVDTVVVVMDLCVVVAVIAVEVMLFLLLLLLVWGVGRGAGNIRIRLKSIGVTIGEMGLNASDGLVLGSSLSLELLR